ncbi:hypothetical protein CMK12_16270 [Candidatus Poribacteria bacterium]|nr:hypothetical protein [Candidatus Poribacteria bacterium]
MSILNWFSTRKRMRSGPHQKTLWCLSYGKPVQQIADDLGATWLSPYWVKTYNHRLQSNIEKKKSPYSLAHMSTFTPRNMEPSFLRTQKGLWILPTPSNMPDTSWDDFLNLKALPEMTRSLGNVLRDTLPGLNSKPERQLLQWYCLFRGQLKIVMRFGRPCTILTPHQATGPVLNEILSTASTTVIAQQERGLRLPKTLPLIYRQIVTDAWVSFLQICEMSDKPGNIRLVDQHLSSIFQRVILSNLSTNSPKIEEDGFSQASDKVNVAGDKVDILRAETKPETPRIDIKV